MDNDNKTIFNINGVYGSREFYGISKDDMLLTEPLLRSTLFWKPGVITTKNGETDFFFVTGDITGLFRIVIQGIGAGDVIFGERNFIVKQNHIIVTTKKIIVVILT